MKKLSKRLFALLLAGVLLVSCAATAAAAEPLTLTVSGKIADGVLTAEVTVPADSKLTDGRLVFTYDPEELTLSSAAAGKLLTKDNSESDINTSVSGTVAFAWAGDALKEAGSLLTLTFAVKAEGKELADLTLNLTAEDLYCGKDAVKAEIILPEPSAPERPFVDVPETYWAYDEIYAAYDAGLFLGTTATTFGPEVALNRGMIVTVLWRLAGEEKAAKAADFADVTANDYYAEAVSWGVEKGIVKGYGDDYFRPMRKASRQEVATILYRYAKAMGVELEEKVEGGTFVDYDQVATWAREAIDWTIRTGILIGKPGNRLDPMGNTTRAQAATILVRFIQ